MNKGVTKYDDGEHVSAARAAELLGRSVTWVRDAARKEGAKPTRKPGVRCVLFSHELVRLLAEKHGIKLAKGADGEGADPAAKRMALMELKAKAATLVLEFEERIGLSAIPSKAAEEIRGAVSATASAILNSDDGNLICALMGWTAIVALFIDLWEDKKGEVVK